MEKSTAVIIKELPGFEERDGYSYLWWNTNFFLGLFYCRIGDIDSAFKWLNEAEL